MLDDMLRDSRNSYSDTLYLDNGTPSYLHVSRMRVTFEKHFLPENFAGFKLHSGDRSVITDIKAKPHEALQSLLCDKPAISHALESQQAHRINMPHNAAWPLPRLALERMLTSLRQ